MRVNISFRNLEEVGADLLRLSHRLEKSSLEMKNNLALLIKDRIVLDMKESKGGRVYRRRNPNRTVQASAPGESPLYDLGSFAASIQVQKASGPHQPARIGSNDFRADLFEFGGVDPGSNKYIEPRPWLWPNIERTAKDVRRIMDEAVRKAL